MSLNPHGTNFQSSSLSGRPPLRKSATSSTSITDPHHSGRHLSTSTSTSTIDNTTHKLSDTRSMGDVASVVSQRRSSINSALLEDPLLQPHAMSFTSQVLFSSSLIREQSLALGHLEQLHTLDLPAAVAGTSLATSTSLSSMGMAGNTGSLQFNQPLFSSSFGVRRQQLFEGIPDREIPSSGLSMLLKSNGQSTGRPEAASSSTSAATPTTALLVNDSDNNILSPFQKPHPVSSQDPSLDHTLSRHNTRTTMTTSAAGDGHIVEGGEGEDMLVSSSTDATGFLARWKNFFIGPQDETFSSDEAESLLPQTALTNGYDSVGTNVRNQGRYCRPRRSMSSLITTQESAWDDFKSNKWTSKMIIQKCLYEPIGFLPAVVLGLLLNLLDAISYGLIIFPLNTAPFQSLGPDGISMFFVSCIISQLVFSLGGSAFKGGNGGMMIEVVPFLHLMAETIVGRLGAENKDEVIATTILAYALSAIMTGAAFMSLGYFKLGSLIAFFPRHILVGCIGGVGWFLVITGLEVTSRMTSELTYSYETFRFLFLNHHVFSLWFTPLSLALVLRLLQRKIKHPFLIPTFFMAVPMLFYLIVAIAGFDWDMLRENGWVFPMPSGNAPGWQFYTFFDLGKTNWSAILETVPVMLALTFFGILHVPINVPALAVSTGQDNVDINRELVAHGYSNLLSGCFGTLQNYLVYTNSVLFIKSGGNSRVAGIMLAVATLIVFLIGPWIVGYIPVMVVGALIFHLGMDLVKEALLDTWGLVHRFEYLTIILIVVFMAALGFVEGIFVGILLACVFFVVKNSRKECIRYSCTGESAKSTVRRVYRQQKFLRQVGRQIYIFKLQGDMFFGTINKVEMAIRDVFSRRRWESNPIQFLVLDFALVRDIDFSAAEGFGRIRRTVRAKGVCLVLSGLDEEMSRTLQMVGVWGAGSGNGMSEGHGHGQPIQESFDTQVFPGLSEALEYCENCLLQTFYRAKASAIETARRQRQLEETAAQEEDGDSETSRFFSEQIPNSPRKSFLFNVARDTLLAHDRPIPQPMNLQEPVPTLLAAFSDTRENPIDFFLQLSMYFTRKTVLAGTILWRQGGLPVDGLYIIETGTMRSIQEFQDSGVIRRTAEVALPGTIAGEIGLFTGQVRTSTLVSETDGVVWGLSQDQFQKMVKDDPSLAVEFMRIAMSYSAERLNLMSQYAFSLS